MDKRTGSILFGVGLFGLGAYLIMTRRQLDSLGEAAVNPDSADLFLAVLPPEAQPYADVIRHVADEQQIDPFIIAAIGMQETRWGTSPLLDQPGPGGRGDGGHGHGLMQIDDRTWGPWLASNNWADPYTNVSKGVSIFASGLSTAARQGLTGDQATLFALSAYNHGPGHAVAGDAYSSSVWAFYQPAANAFAAGLGSAVA